MPWLRGSGTQKCVLIGQRERISLEHWVFPRRMDRARQEATIAEFLWQLEMLKREMTKGKKIAQHLAGGQESFACFS